MTTTSTTGTSTWTCRRPQPHRPHETVEGECAGRPDVPGATTRSAAAIARWAARNAQHRADGPADETSHDPGFAPAHCAGTTCFHPHATTGARP